jgi:hypothetical protein
MTGALLFAGPTLARIRRWDGVALDAVEVRPPIARGDLERLVHERERGTAIVVDGLFHLGRLAVGHAELRDALARGWQVWGLSSMGAIRAAEMASYGMRGFGKVFARYRDEPDFRDDEVTLLHEPDEPYRELSEPLIHLREGVRHLVARGALDRELGARVIGELEERWFGERTLQLWRERLLAHGAAAAPVDELLRDFDACRLKAIDLRDFLRVRPFEGGP